MLLNLISSSTQSETKMYPVYHSSKEEETSAEEIKQELVNATTLIPVLSNIVSEYNREKQMYYVYYEGDDCYCGRREKTMCGIYDSIEQCMICVLSGLFAYNEIGPNVFNSKTNHWTFNYLIKESIMYAQQKRFSIIPVKTNVMCTNDNTNWFRFNLEEFTLESSCKETLPINPNISEIVQNWKKQLTRDLGFTFTNYQSLKEQIEAERIR